jgi:hypothetical protein
MYGPSPLPVAPWPTARFDRYARLPGSNGCCVMVSSGVDTIAAPAIADTTLLPFIVTSRNTIFPIAPSASEPGEANPTAAVVELNPPAASKRGIREATAN